VKKLIEEWVAKWRPTPPRERARNLWRERHAIEKMAVDYASKRDWTTFVVHEDGKFTPLPVEPDSRLEEFQHLLERNARQLVAVMGAPEELLRDVESANRKVDEDVARLLTQSTIGAPMPVYPLNPDGRPVTVQRGVSRYDENGNRISVPDEDAIDRVGALARQMVARGLAVDPQWRQEMLGQFPEREEDEYETRPSAFQLTEIRLIELEEWEIVARTTTSRRRRTTTPGRARVSGPTTKNDPIFVWGMQSSKPRNGGQFITYEVRLNDDGSVSCNCPGWIFKKKTDDRGCKHTRHPEVANNMKDLFERHQRGEQLPTIDPPEGAQSATTPQPTAPTAKDQMKGFGRLVILDD
jgi:hypothetical protein